MHKGSFGESLAFNSKGPIKFGSLNDQPYQARPTLFDVKPNETLFYLFPVSVNKCSGSSYTIDDPYARVCILNKVKKYTCKICNLISGVHETRFLVQHKSYECKC